MSALDEFFGVVMRNIHYEAECDDNGARVMTNLRDTPCPRCKAYVQPDVEHLCGDRALVTGPIPQGISASSFTHMMQELLKVDAAAVKVDAAADAPTGTFSHWADCKVSWTVWEKLGEDYLLCVPTACKVSPPGCRELKMSEYWQLKEAADAAKEAAPA